MTAASMGAPNPRSTDLTAPVAREEVEAELIASLYQRTRPLLIANIGAMVLLTGALWTSAPHLYLLGWAVTLFAWTMLRFALAKLYLRQERSVGEAKNWVYAFSVGSGVAGTLWGLSIYLIGSLSPDHAKLVAAFMMAALSASAIAGYTNSLIAFAAFTIPALLPFGLRMVWFDGEPSYAIAAFVVFWGWLLWSMARHLNDGFKSNIALLLGNQRLVEHLSIAKDRAERANQAKTRFLSNMSHELRTPLNAVLGYSEMIKLEMLGPIGHVQYADYINHIHDRGRHLLGFVNQVFDLSQLESGTVALQDERVAVDTLLAEVVEPVTFAAQRDRILLHVTSPAGNPGLIADHAKLRQALGSLLDNAIKFTPPEGRVTLTATLGNDGGMRLSVSDTGIGIDAAHIERITVPFHQLENQDHLKRLKAIKHDVGQTSTGLGLPVAKLLTDLHGGRLDIESTPGVGTTVSLWLPPDRVLQPQPLARAAE
ncbi:ATP-binding protein [Dongia rigui]|uniref:histidine kinase n=1 Tax=Dongia rigui TaxID=940149 RepID=A0ABU5E0K0_9PROT|nr:ATP-binding protein [Dongia rigui]MDY0872734.1 ATP-binding protein [Dongia rigui]